MDSTDRYISVSTFSDMIKLSMERLFPGTIYLKGEISGFRPSSTGHWYLTIKDDEAVISAVVFKGTHSSILDDFNKSGIKNIKDGQEVLVEGKINLYKKSGSYNIIINKMKPLGIGELYFKFEELKKELSELGFFDQAIKKNIPSHPRVLGIVTSPTGAALQDILNVLKRRAPGIQVKIFPVAVQGDNAKNEIVKAINYADFNFINDGKDKVDVLILARGGGSIEDLWPFNEKIVAYAINKCNIPIISGIGHEIDFTIADFCSDLRAPTPSAAAELVSKSSEEINSTISSLQLRIQAVMKSMIRNARMRFDAVSSAKLNRAVRRIYESKLQDHAYLDEKIRNIFKNTITSYKHSLELVNKRLIALNPLNILERGYSVVYRVDDGKLISSVSSIDNHDLIKVVMKDGDFKALVENKDI